MLNEVKARLASFNYLALPADEQLISYCVSKAETYILNSCNLFKVPSELDLVLVDMAIAEFLNTKYSTGQLNDFDLDAAVKIVSAGDVSVHYMGSDSRSSEDKLGDFIDLLQGYGMSILASYRSVKW